ncbi:MAG: hypothetical protein IJI92_10290 [Erysipelotrichaceae bacterium]|nr:hypothetical protein [Erysipelotrichaceae bacterium]MBQ6494238.1 hypothetical protein [Erysipelotrichaceae bacterium]
MERSNEVKKEKMRKIFWIVAMIALMMLTGCAKADDSQKLAVDVIEDVGQRGRSLNKDKADVEGIEIEERNSEKGLAAANGNPTFEDFAFYDDLLVSGLPDNIVYPKVKYMDGIWKYEIRIREEVENGAYMDEIGLAELYLDDQGENFSILLHPQLMNYNGEVYPESDEEVGYEAFEGGWNQDSGLTLTGNGVNMDILVYYFYNNVEYIIGSLYTAEDYIGDFIMIRD